ncbi:MAG TPA: hypothetical protein VF481_10145 [Novosphingobium sp.]
MPLYKVFPTDPSLGSAEVEASSTERILGIVQGLECHEADVFLEDRYAFSIRLEQSGIWSIFQRGEAQPEIPLTG